MSVRWQAAIAFRSDSHLMFLPPRNPQTSDTVGGAVNPPCGAISTRLVKWHEWSGSLHASATQARRYADVRAAQAAVYSVDAHMVLFPCQNQLAEGSDLEAASLRP